MVDLLPGKVRAGQGHTDQRRLEEQTQTLIPFAQLLLGVFTRTDILQRTIHPHQLSPIALGNATNAQPARLALGGEQAHFNVELFQPIDQLLQYLLGQHSAAGIQIAQGAIEIRRAVFRVQLVDAKAAGAPVHILLWHVQHPTAKVGDVLGLAEQIALLEQLVALRTYLGG